ncbi:endogenous retrovirus group S71 member 1 Env polyprotein-like [Pteropus medius]|uniref:endogenous retrovirus group S71 member 1 Env polyprotein-like n=1 Tax=Pteropus vampyrus TaxID=132908 RepID=UPI00196A2FA5|nr:endogenous retrovirus group S71 member 1 Env polyprotein-like [Pteropus giganteus]
MLDAVFGFVNQTNPNITSDCWFCLNPAPPYYVGLGATAAFGNSTHQIRNISVSNSSTSCPCGRAPKLTLGDLQGQGTCIHSTSYPLSTSPYAQNCDSITPTDTTPPFYLVAPQGTWFACNTGLTPCISSNYWSQGTYGFYVLVHVIPQVYFYSREGGREHFQYIDHHIAKRAPILVPALVGLRVAGSTAVGAAALVTGDSNYLTLNQQVDKDLQDLETSVSHLETSVNSLAEVVLQDRRGLDLLFLKQRGLCVALDEICCFCANHSGIIRDSLALVRQRLRDREEQRQRTGSWYENLFNGSPWLTTLLTPSQDP